MKKNLKYLFVLIPVVLLAGIFFMPDRSVKEDIVYNTNYQGNEKIKVSVYGEIKSPGVYYLKENDTFLDLLNKCGQTDYTNTSDINLTTCLINGACYEVEITEDNKKNVCVKVSQSTVIPEFNLSSEDLININTASINLLISLSGIGSVKAAAIISYREKTKFSSKEELLRVDGITEKIYDKIKDYITV